MGGYPYPLPGVSRQVEAGFGLAPTRIRRVTCPVVRRLAPAHTRHVRDHKAVSASRGYIVGSVIKKRRKRMAKKKHRKLLKRTRIQRRRAGK